MNRGEALARLRAQVALGHAIIGAGAGTGLSAKCAEAGGADLLVIYNSGRFRMAGRGSLAGMSRPLPSWPMLGRPRRLRPDSRGIGASPT